MRTSSFDKENSGRKTERRGNPRCEIDLLMNRFLNGYPYLSRASDISRTGMRIHPISGARAASRFVGLQFQLPGCADVITASGEVVAGSPEEGPYGVRFTRLPAVSAARIGRFLSVRA